MTDRYPKASSGGGLLIVEGEAGGTLYNYHSIDADEIAAASSLADADLLLALLSTGELRKITCANFQTSQGGTYRKTITAMFRGNISAVTGAGNYQTTQKQFAGVPGSTNTLKSIKIIGASGMFGASPAQTTIKVSKGDYNDAEDEAAASINWNQTYGAAVQCDLELDSEDPVFYLWIGAAGNHTDVEVQVELEVS